MCRLGPIFRPDKLSPGAGGDFDEERQDKCQRLLRTLVKHPSRCPALASTRTQA